LEDYLSEGWTFIAAYGDSSTDFEAYARAGLDKSRVFALKREGDQRCQPGAWEGCYASWAEQMDTISRLIHTNQGAVANE
jgi:phosphatidate phosphatase PAH1